VKAGLWLNISQNIDRIGSGTPGVLCTSGLWYSYEVDAVLDGCDALMLQGHPECLTHDPDLSTSEKRVLAGESYHLPSCGVAMYALFLNPWAPWWVIK
jgi:hypothetical protein